jgi:predicted transcriptional regulator
MNRYYKVKDHSGLVRDSSTNAILNTNCVEYNNYLNALRNKEQEKKKMEELESQVKEIKNDVGEIKKLLLKIINN